MVTVARLLILLVLNSMAILAQAGELLLQVQHPQTELGLPIIADLYAVASKEDLNDVDLRDLHSHYEVIIKENAGDISDPRWPGEHIQYLKLELYPLQTGEQSIPSITLGRLHSTPRTVLVSEGKTREGPIRVKHHVSSEIVWQRQQLLVTLTITSPDRYVTLQTENTSIPNAEVIPLPSRREFNAGGGSTLQIGWALFPLSAGQQQFKLPVVNYRLGGVVKRKYYLPPLTLTVKALPAYLPPTIPVGRITLASEISPGRFLQPQRLAFWRIRLQGENVSPLWMPPVLRQIKSDETVTFLPGRSERKHEDTLSGIRSRVTHEIPFKFTDSGHSTLPEIRVQYFDPDTARLETLQLQPKPLWVIGMGWRLLAAALLLALVGYIARVLAHNLHTWRQRKQARDRALMDLAASTTPGKLRMALRKFALAEGWPGNLSLSQWLACWDERYTGTTEIHALLDKLSQISYGRQQAPDIQGVKTELYTTLQQAKPRQRKWFSL